MNRTLLRTPSALDRAVPPPSEPSVLSSSSWRRPSFEEFIERLQGEFGPMSEMTTVLAVGLGPRERLDPEDVKALCQLLGVPPEDFGV